MCRYNFLLQLFLFGYFLAFVECALMLTPAAVNNEFPNSCWNERDEKAVAVGETWEEPNCIRATCFMYRDELFVEMAGCGKVHVPEGCKTVAHSTEKYPLCCPQMSCGDEEVTLGPEYDEFTSWVDAYYDDTTTADPESTTETESVVE